MLNKIICMGRLGKNPELRRTDSGKAVASFSIACDRDFKNKSTGSTDTDWLDVVCWGNTAEFVNNYFTAGRMAIVSGRLQIRSWTDKDGNKRRTAEIVADNVYFGDSKQSASDDHVGFAKADSIPAAGQNFDVLDDDDSQLPF